MQRDQYKIRWRFAQYLFCRVVFLILECYFLGSINKKLFTTFTLLLVESLVLVIFYVIFLIRYAVIINYFGKKISSN